MRCLDSDSTCARLHMHVWAPLTSAGTCGGKGEGAENARLAWAEIASGSLHSTFTFFSFFFFKHCENTSRQAQTTYFHCVLCLWAKRASTTVRARFQAYVHTREKESQRTGLPGCRAPRTVAWSVCRAAARGQLAGARRTELASPLSRLSRRHWDSSRGRLGPAGIETHETRWARFC